MNIDQIASESAQIAKLLTPLAEKIGQTGEYVFGLFVRQVYIEALVDMLWIVPGIICLIYSQKVWNWTKDNNTHTDAELAYFASIVLFVVGWALILVPIAELIQVMTNPQYEAIQLILSTIKGG